MAGEERSAGEDWIHSLSGIVARLPDEPAADRFHYPLSHGSMRAGIYAPRRSDGQGVHRQDELYIIISGGGLIDRDGEVRRFAVGDLIFVPAGVRHRFQDFDSDFKCWVIFWGPDGGE